MEIRELLKRCVRIMHISRKPTNSEFEKVAKVTALGMAIFGIIGLALRFIIKAI